MHGIIVAHKPSHTLESILSKPKDRIKIVERSDVVYKIPCSNCDMCYIGETSKQVKVRVEEHRKNITQHHQPSLIYQHIAQEHHDMNWNNVSILNKHQNTYSRKFLEACHTQVTPLSFNNSITLPTTYKTIIHKSLGNFLP